MERHSLDPDEQTGLARYVSTLQAEPPTPVRIGLVQQMEQNGRLTEFSLDVLSGVLRGVFSAISAAVAPGTALKQEEIEAELVKMRTTLEPTIRQQILVTSLYEYRALSDDELRRYTTFLGSDTGVQSTRLVMNTVSAVLTDFFADVVQKLREQSLSTKGNDDSVVPSNS